MTMNTPPSSLISRLPDWAHRLDALVQQRLNLPFAWGPNDCAVWGADAYLALTGVDALAELRNAPRRSAASALRALRKGGGMPGFMQRGGVPPLAGLPYARCGDLVLIEQGEGQRWPVLAVCVGEVALAPGALGLEPLDMRLAAQGWQV